MMILYEVVIAIIAIGTLIRCETGDGILLGFVIWFLLGGFPLIAIYKGKKMTNAERKKLNDYYNYQEEYFNNFGELP